MRTKLGVVALALLFAVLPAHAKRRPASVIAETEYLRTAREAAAWLMSIERRTAPDNITWPMSTYSESVSAGMVTGAAGVGTFFLELHRITRDARYLERAKGAANYVATANPQSLSHEWLGGAAGTGGFLLDVWRATGEQRYLDAAKRSGDFLVQSAINDNGGFYWKHQGSPNTYTGLAHGASGSGIFLVDLYNATKDARYLDTATKAWTWLSRYTVPLGSDGIGWKRLVVDTVMYPGWCGGGSGIVYFLDKLARATNEPSIALALTRTAAGFANSALPRGTDGAAWDHYGPNTGNGIIYCHGASSVIAALATTYAVTRDERALETARKGARWLDAVAIDEATGLSWNHFASSRSHLTGLLTGTASVGHAFLRLWSVDPNSAHLDKARGAAAYLIDLADHPAPGQSRWINYTHTPGSGDDPKGYETGWYGGAAGIGLFLLELDQASRGVTVPPEFSGAHP